VTTTPRATSRSSRSAIRAHVAVRDASADARPIDRLLPQR
jgi:hypothetical protein